jgi:YVTN family beta-propeller protein/autotransporter-associated beta strand protein
VSHLSEPRNSISISTSLSTALIAIGALVLSCPGVSFGQVTSYAFVPSTGVGTTVKVIDTTTHGSLGDVTVGTAPRSVAITPDGRRAYVANSGTNTVAVLDVVTRTIVTTVNLPGGGVIHSLAMAPDGRRLYVAKTFAVEVIDLTGPGHLVFGSVAAPAGAVLRVIAVPPDGLTALVTSTHGTYPLNLTTEAFGTVIPTGASSWEIAITPNGQTAYVTDFTNNHVMVVDVALQSVSGAPIAVGASPWGVAFSPDGAFAYVANNDADTVSVIDVANRTVVATLSSDTGPRDVAFTPDGRYAFVATGANTVTVIDAATHTPVAPSIPMGANPVASGGHFITPNIIVQPGGPFSIANDAALESAGFKEYVPFNQGTLRLTGDWTTTRHLSMLAGGGTIDTNGFDATVHGGVLNDGQLTKIGAGTLTLEDVSSHDGGTVVTAGTLMMAGSHNSPLIVTGGTLRGHGEVGDVTIGDATWAPGHGSIGLFDADNVTMSAGTTLEILLAGLAPGVGHDAVVNSGPAAINGARLVVLTAFEPQVGARFPILFNATGTFHNLPEGATFVAGHAPYAPGPYTFRITYLGGDGNDVELIYDAAPTVTGLGPLTIDEDAGLQSIPFSILDDFVLDPSALITSAASMNQALLPNANIGIAGIGSTRALQFTTAPNASGTVEIRLTASDGLSSRTVAFMLTVNPVNDAPTISPVAPQSIPENMPLDPVTFTVDDVESDAASLTVTATSSNPSVVPDANLIVGGSGATRTIAVAPVIGVRGETTVTLTVSDGQRSSSTTFLLTLTERTYYLAEGATGPFFDTDILIANPNETEAPIVVTFLKDDGTPIVQTRTLAATSRVTIRVDDVEGLENSTFSTIVTSTNALPIVVERTMRWDATGYGAHTEKATAGAAYEWTFAEGAEGSFFHTYFLLTNPHPTANTAGVWYLREGEPSLFREYQLAPGSRTTIRTALEPELRDRSFGAIVSFQRPGAAERAMYFGDDPVWLGGHAAAGATAPYSTSWFLAEGATGDYFTTFVLLANPGLEAADVTMTYLPDTGVPVTKPYTIQPGQRLTRNIAFEDASLAHAAVATRVESTKPIVVERAQYWGQPAWIDAHVSTGVTAAAPRWGLAEGRVGGVDGAQTYILLANPEAAAADVTVTFLRENGTTVLKTFTVPPTSRFNVAVVPGAGSMAPELADESFGARIESTAPIVVERSLYTNAGGVTWAAGTNATATRLP